MNEDKKQHDVTPQVGKRYVTHDGWITPPYNGEDNWPIWELISEYVEPTADTYRRDLEAKLFVKALGDGFNMHDSITACAQWAIHAAAALIEAQELK